MSFNRDIKLDANRVSTRSSGRGALVGGGSIVTVVLVVLISQFSGIDLTGLLGSSTGADGAHATSSTIDMSVCDDGDSANQYVQCRMVATAESLDEVWAGQLPAQAGSHYTKPGFVL